MKTARTRVVRQSPRSKPTPGHLTFRPPMRTPGIPRTASRPGHAGAGPALPMLTPAQLKSVTQVAPHTVTIDSVVWDGLIPQNPFSDPIGSGTPVYVQPQGPLTINYRQWRGLAPFSNALIVARLADGLLGPTHTYVTLPPSYGELSGVIQLDGWATPFPSTLYGYHQLFLDLYLQSDSGSLLPAEAQTPTPDPQRYVHSWTDWSWVYVSPGCRTTAGAPAGIDWCDIVGFSCTPTTIPLNATGTAVATGQKIKVNWAFNTAGLAPTAFGYPGSFPGAHLSILNAKAVDLGSGPTGQLTIDISGLPWSSAGVWLSTSKATTCGWPMKGIGLLGQPQGAPLPVAGPPDIHQVSSSIDPQFPSAGQAFTVFFTCQNIGGKDTGDFVAHLELDNGAQAVDIDVSSLAPGASNYVYWTIAGLPEGDHWVYCTYDWRGTVADPNRADNLGYLGFQVWA
jgi:hypothetical protein